MPRVSRFTSLEEIPQLVTVAELARFLGVGRGKAYDLVRRGEVEHVRLGRLVRIPRVAIARFVDAGKGVQE
jgi:excisionase family DNA binding protein